MKAVRVVLLGVLVVGIPAMHAGMPALHAQQRPPVAAPEGFVPVDQLPAQEELPAAPLVAAAYGIAWAVMLVYLWSIWQRLGRIDRDIAEVARRLEPGARR